jgi:HPr kinase/phosphorylase
MASILEVAARNELLKNAGHHAAREFFGQLEGALIGSERPADESAVLPPVRFMPPPPSSGAGMPPMPRTPLAHGRSHPESEIGDLRSSNLPSFGPTTPRGPRR